MMKSSFNNILVPVDFTINTDVAIAKALTLADTEGASLHLLHVRKGLRSPVSAYDSGPAARKLENWKKVLEGYHRKLRVNWWIDVSGSVGESILSNVFLLEADLVVIGKTRKNPWIPFSETIVPTRISGQTGVPVLTVRPGALQTKLRTIVVPITGTLPLSKMAALSLLCSRHNPTIHLVAFGNNAAVSTESAETLLKVYQWVRGQLHCPAAYALLDGANKPKSLLCYSEKVAADLLLVYPQQETKLDIWNRHISDILPPESKVQVLAVQPETKGYNL